MEQLTRRAVASCRRFARPHPSFSRHHALSSRDRPSAESHAPASRPVSGQPLQAARRHPRVWSLPVLPSMRLCRRVPLLRLRPRHLLWSRLHLCRKFPPHRCGASSCRRPGRDRHTPRRRLLQGRHRVARSSSVHRQVQAVFPAAARRSRVDRAPAATRERVVREAQSAPVVFVVPCIRHAPIRADRLRVVLREHVPASRRVLDSVRGLALVDPAPLVRVAWSRKAHLGLRSPACVRLRARVRQTRSVTRRQKKAR